MSTLPSAIIFDFDGVIADTERLHLRAFRHVLAQFGVELTAADYYGRYLGLDDFDVLRSVARDCGTPLDASRLEAMLEEKGRAYQDLIATATVLYDGVERRVREWSGQLPLAIASGALRREVEAILARHDLLDCFLAIVTARDVARGKPAPDPYLAALARLSAARLEPIRPGNCVVIEDSLPGIEAASAAGMRTVAVTTNHPAERLSAADLVVASVAALDLPALEGIFRVSRSKQP